jgi:hypothetical protein
MGGKGSGMWYRWSKKTTIEETKRIDIRRMKKQGLIVPGRLGSLSWSRGGEPSGDIQYQCFEGRLKLIFRYRENGGEWQSVIQSIRIDETSCNYGGKRLWFLCPDCGKRVAVLSGYRAKFLCRHCYGLPYASQNEGRLNRLISQKHKLGERIFHYYEYGEGWGKKKGMHWTTFNRLNTRFRELESRLDSFAARYGF